MNEDLPTHAFSLLLLIFATLVASILSSPLQAQYAGKSNDVLVSELLTERILPVIEEKLVNPSPLRFTTPKPSPLATWIEAKLTEACLQKEYVVYSSADSVKTISLVRFSNPQVKIVYQAAARSWNLRTSEYSRDVMLTMQLEVVDANGVVQASIPIEEIYADRISRSDFASLQKSPFSFLRGTKKDSGLIKRWLEPVAMTAATMTVIYLFYSLRSN
ncbi:MAG: hypothetical protein ACRBF0_10310 [Calditrichia bacterium]